MEKRKTLTDFDQGVLYAAGLLAGYCDHPTEAAWLLREAGLGKADVSGLDDFDKINLKKVQVEKGIKLQGLKRRPHD